MKKEGDVRAAQRARKVTPEGGERRTVDDGFQRTKPKERRTPGDLQPSQFSLPVRLQFIGLDTRQFHQVALQPTFQRFVAVDRHRNTCWMALLDVDMMAALHASKLPFSLLK